MKKLGIIAVAFCFGILIYTMLPKTTYIDINASTPYISLEEMTVKADMIMEATVAELGASQWNMDANGERIDQMHTDVRVKPMQVIKEDSQKIKTRSSSENERVRTDVGRIGDTVQTSSGLPSLNEGETALLFLKRASDDSGEFYMILGASQGKFAKQEIDGAMVYTNGRDTLPVEEVEQTITQIAEENANQVWDSDYYTEEEIEQMNNALFESGES